MRPTNEETIWEIAESVANQATCDRRKVGCVIADYGLTIIGVGSNVAPDGTLCSETYHVMEGGHCVRAAHAEITALMSALRTGGKTIDAQAYCTVLPCINCMNALYLAGIVRIHYDEDYEREEKENLFMLATLYGISLVRRMK